MEKIFLIVEENRVLNISFWYMSKNTISTNFIAHAMIFYNRKKDAKSFLYNEENTGLANAILSTTNQVQQL